MIKKAANKPKAGLVQCPTCHSPAKQLRAEWITARLIRGTCEMIQRRYRCAGKNPHEFFQYEMTDEVVLLITREQIRVAEFCSAAQRMFMMMRDIADESLGKRPDQGQFEHTQAPVRPDSLKEQ